MRSLQQDYTELEEETKSSEWIIEDHAFSTCVIWLLPHAHLSHQQARRATHRKPRKRDNLLKGWGGGGGKGEGKGERAKTHDGEKA